MSSRRSVLDIQVDSFFKFGGSLVGTGVLGAVALGMSGSVTNAAGSNEMFYNEDVANLTGSPQNSLTMVFSGDQSANLDGNGWFNGLPGTNTSSPVNVVVSGGNTYVTWSALQSVASGASAHIGYTLLGGISEPEGDGSPDILDKFWGSGTLPGVTADEEPAPTLDLNTVTPPTGPYKYVMIYVDATLDGPNNEAQDWEEVAVAASDPPDLSVFDDQSDPLTLNNVKFFLSDTQIPLDDLNNNFYPPTDSMWQPVPGISNGTTESVGQDLLSSPLPEPASLALVALATPILLRRRRCG